MKRKNEKGKNERREAAAAAAAVAAADVKVVGKAAVDASDPKD